MTQRKRPSRPLGGQSRRARSLGANDPRTHRAAQALAGTESYIDNDTIRKDRTGRLYAHHVLNADETGETEPEASGSALSGIAAGLFFGGMGG